MSERTPFNLRHLEGIDAIRRTRSFSAAASEINLTQSALTQAVAILERRLQRRLFDRTSRGARATAAGDMFADSIERALHAINNAGQDALPPVPSRGPLSRRATGTQLLALAAVERAGSFRGGARQSGLTEASIHRAVRDLEATLGVQFVAKMREGIGVTAAGAMIARATRQAHAEIERGLEALLHQADRQLVIGTMPLVRAGLLPSAMARFCLQNDRVRLRSVEAPYADLLSGLLDGRLDLLLGALREPAPDGVVQHRLFDDDLVVAARSDHPLAHTTDWSTSALAEYPWAASPRGTPRRTRWEEMVNGGGVHLIPRIESSSATAIRGLLLQGDWLAMLSPDQFRIERELGLLVVLRGLLPASVRPIGITTRAGSIPDDAQAAFLEVLQRCAGEQAERRPEQHVLRPSL